jgi:molybdopterin-guanine dinucleotide biosynthesis protein MobB
MRERRPMTAACVIAVRGYSGAGKTTLIEKALPELKKEGLSVGILKHSGHELWPDKEGKDTARFYKAGADFVFAHDSRQGFARFPCKDMVLGEALHYFSRGLDLILVEGHKGPDIRAVWIQSAIAGESPATGVRGAPFVISRDDPGYLGKFIDFAISETRDFHAGRFMRGGLLIGGQSTRMRTSKGLLEMDGVALVRKSLDTLEEVVASAVLLGASSLPQEMTDLDRLPDAPHVEGPMAGILSAFRWDPYSTWIISAVDMPLMARDAWTWLLGQRRPGAWAVMPRTGTGSKVEATGACYEPMIFEYVDALARKGVFTLQRIAEHPRVITPEIPGALAHAWKNVNTPEDWRRIRRER